MAAEETAVAALLAATGAPLAVMDETGCCVGATRTFARMFGHASADSLLGRPLDLPRSAEVNPFSPGGGRSWRLATLHQPECSAGAPPAALLDDLPVLIDAKGRDLRYLFINRYAARLFDLAPEAVLGRTATEVLGPEQGAFLERCDADVLAGRQVMPVFEDQFAGVDGVPRDWLIAKTPLHDADGRVMGVASIGVDVTERRRTRQAAAADVGEGRTAARTRAGFLAGVGHQLRSPLTSIIGCAEFLAAEGLGPLGHDSYRDFAGDIANAARHLQGVVNDIIDMANVEAGRLVLAEEPLDIARTVASVHRMMEASARHKHLTVSVVAAENLPPLVGDPKRIRQILVNLLSNAIKFTPDYGRIAVAAVRRDPAGDLVLSVRDTGVGIAPEDIAVALTPFGRLEHGPVRQEEGTGLGLPLTKAIVEAHGGRLELASEPGAGTEVRAVFPAWRLRGGAAGP